MEQLLDIINYAIPGTFYFWSLIALHRIPNIEDGVKVVTFIFASTHIFAFLFPQNMIYIILVIQSIIYLVLLIKRNPSLIRLYFLISILILLNRI